MKIFTGKQNKHKVLWSFLESDSDRMDHGLETLLTEERVNFENDISMHIPSITTFTCLSNYLKGLTELEMYFLGVKTL